jgi:nitrogen regulatory protein PII
MQAVKRVEIVTDTIELDRVLELLEKAGVSGYTVVRNAEGKGHRGVRSGDDVTRVFQNSYVLTACTAEQVERVVEAIRPVLKRVGGVCLVSDALWVLH